MRNLRQTLWQKIFRLSIESGFSLMNKKPNPIPPPRHSAKIKCNAQQIFILFYAESQFGFIPNLLIK